MDTSTFGLAVAVTVLLLLAFDPRIRGVRGPLVFPTTGGPGAGSVTQLPYFLDLADLRRAMGYQQWNLHGVSYGARLALITMREQPEGCGR